MATTYYRKFPCQRPGCKGRVMHDPYYGTLQCIACAREYVAIEKLGQVS